MDQFVANQGPGQCIGFVKSYGIYTILGGKTLNLVRSNHVP